MIDGTPPSENVPQEKVRGPNGIVGQATASLQIKQLWKETQFSMEGRKGVSVRKRGSMSLKRYARSLLAGSNKEQSVIAKTWLDNKLGSLNQTRSDKNIARVGSERVASKSARKKSKGGGKTTTTETK